MRSSLKLLMMTFSILMLTIGFILFLLFSLLSIVIYSVCYGISPMPSTFKAINGVLVALPSTFHGTIYELGSGWGTLALALAKRYPQCRVEAYEISPLPYLFSKFLTNLWGAKNLQIHRCDFYSVSLHEASAVICYLFPDAMRQLKMKFEKELTPSTLVISNTFAIPGWTPTEIFVIDDLYHTKIYQYRVPRSTSNLIEK